MRMKSPSRRLVVEQGAITVAASDIPRGADARKQTKLSLKGEELIQPHCEVWQRNDGRTVDVLVTDDFTFSSPLRDHNNESAFNAQSGDSRIAFIKRFYLQQLLGSGPDAFVMYLSPAARRSKACCAFYLK